MRQTKFNLLTLSALSLAAISVGIIGCGADVTVNGQTGGAGTSGAQQNSDGDENGFSLKIPGIVDVDVAEDGSTKVKAPGTDVNVDRQNGKVNVKSLGTEVDVDQRN